MIQTFVNYQMTAQRDEGFKKALSKSIRNEQFLLTLPLFESDIHDLEGLYQLGRYF